VRVRSGARKPVLIAGREPIAKLLAVRHGVTSKAALSGVTPTRRRRPLRSRLRRAALLAATSFIVVPAVAVLGLRFVDPPFTTVQIQRWMEHPDERRQYDFVPLERISPNLADAVIASEDARFYEHHGLDWTEIGHAVEEKLEDGRLRGASTITQQLARNLFPEEIGRASTLTRKLKEAITALKIEISVTCW